MSTVETMPGRALGYRSPNGCSKQVMTQITPDEQSELDEIATHENRSRSAMVRLLMLRGIEQYNAARAE
ncbi:hypothetical protein KZO85_00190 [Chromohalobacter canadensis]|uniref:hypothetical protein n=1 Tax=Chromohalobacter canadensis TaxID=141389 RepID=UPI0021BE1D81|nr:hypothetical protein [Chromohalobacter canadensis]MCT8466995.1 hypothetical protein [Chromohalobacter canadensis]